MALFVIRLMLFRTSLIFLSRRSYMVVFRITLIFMLQNRCMVLLRAMLVVFRSALIYLPGNWMMIRCYS